MNGEPPPAWMSSAPCRGLDPDLFFPMRGQVLSPIAANCCAACRYNADCLAYSLTEGIKFGVWGGLAERSRRILRARGVLHTATTTVRYTRATHAVTIDRHRALQSVQVEASTA